MDIKILAQRFYDYAVFMKGYSKETVKRYKSVISYFCKYTKVSSIEEVTEDTIRNLFIHGRTERGWRASTFMSHHTTLTVFFRWCQNQKYIKQNFLDDIEKPKIDKSLPVRLTKQDSLRLLEVVYNYPYDYKYLRYRNHAIFSMFIFAGLRRNELLNLKYTDVDIENLSIFIRKGKGSKDRIVPMSFTLSQSLSRYVKERDRLKKTCPEFFASLNRNMGMTNSGLKNLIAILRKLTKIRFSAHKLRHTFATLMLEGGCDIYSLSKMMGHSDIKTTTIYLGASAEHLRGQMVKHPLNDLV